jgi:hypothetical protein
MNRIRLKLVPGKEYLFTHKRLRTFRARYVRIVRAPGADPTDEYYLECERSASDPTFRPVGFRLSNTTLLRPSLITLVQDVPENFSPGMAPPILPTTSGQSGFKNGLRETVRRFFKSIRIG